jgi:glycerol-3-phosphate O-acyltransferase
VRRGDGFEPLPQRDAEYTREVGCRVVEAFSRDNVLQTTHVTAHAVLSLLRAASPGLDVLRLVRMGGRAEDVELRLLYREVELVLGNLRARADRGGLRLSPLLQRGSADDVVADGLRYFAIYHRRAAALRRGDRVVPTDRALLLYYANRVASTDPLGRAQ